MLDGGPNLCPETTRGVVYKIILPSGRGYIGKTERTARDRLQQHFRHKSSPFHEALVGLTPADCRLEILFHSTDPEKLFEVEKQMIEAHRTQDPAVGHNTDAGGRGFTSTQVRRLLNNPEYRARHAAAMKKRSENLMWRAKNAEAARKNAPARAAANRATSGIAPLDGVITVLASQNPRKPGGRRHLAFSLYRTGQSVAEFLEACRPHGLLEPKSPSQSATIAASALRRDLRDGHIRIAPHHQENKK